MVIVLIVNDGLSTEALVCLAELTIVLPKGFLSEFFSDMKIPPFYDEIL